MTQRFGEVRNTERMTVHHIPAIGKRLSFNQFGDIKVHQKWSMEKASLKEITLFLRSESIFQKRLFHQISLSLLTTGNSTGRAI